MFPITVIPTRISSRCRVAASPVPPPRDRLIRWNLNKSNIRRIVIDESRAVVPWHAKFIGAEKPRFDRRAHISAGFISLSNFQILINQVERFEGKIYASPSRGVITGKNCEIARLLRRSFFRYESPVRSQVSVPSDRHFVIRSPVSVPGDRHWQCPFARCRIF